MLIIARGPSALGKFHTKDLFSAQELGIHSEEAMERSFAYVVSGRQIEKKNFEHHFNDFNSVLLAWPERDKDEKSAHIAEAKALKVISSAGQELKAEAEAMFNEFETTGKVDQKRFDLYDASITKLTESIEELVEIEKAANNKSQQAAVTLIKNAAGGMALIGLLSIALAFILGRRISGTVSRPIEQLIIGAQRIAGGNLEEPIEVQSASEIGALGKSLEQMRQNLRRAFISLNHEVNVRKQAEVDLSDSEERLRILVRQMPTIMWTIDTDLVFTSSEGAGLRALGMTPGQVVGINLFEYFDTKDEAFPAIAKHRDALKGISSNYEFEMEGIVFSNYVEPLRDHNGEVTGAIGVAIDITESKKAEAIITHLAHHDALTDLPNRTLFQDRLVHDIAHARRKADKLAIVFVDLDNFKNINDTLGHSVGDQLLKEVAARLNSCMREGDTLARLGGDEFGAIQTFVESAEDAANFAQRMVDSLADPIPVDGRRFHVTCSAGVVIADGTEDDVDQLLARADMAMYQAKSNGRNCYQFFDGALNDQVHEKLSIERDLREAIGRDELVLHYQPIIDLNTGKVCALEALVRWMHPARGLVPPLSFIPIAEASDLIIPIGEWVLRRACTQSQTFKFADGLPVKVAVNVSTIQLMHSDFAAMVETVLAETGANPKYLEIELTESILVQDTEQAMSVLGRLRSLGVSLSIDDFGTGYSSLQYLRNLPVDTLKIDRSFVNDIVKSHDAAAIAGAIINLCQNLGISVIAEGVETADQLDVLRTRGCTQIQGFYFSRPRPVDELEQAVADIGISWRTDENRFSLGKP